MYKIESLSTDWGVVEEHFKLLCSVLPRNNQLTIDKLKTIPQLLKDGGEQLSKLISSSSADVRKINEKIITYLIVKLCYNDSDTSLVRLCDVMDESNDTHTYGMMHTYGLYLVVYLRIHYIRICILALKLLEFLPCELSITKKSIDSLNVFGDALILLLISPAYLSSFSIPNFAHLKAFIFLKSI